MSGTFKRETLEETLDASLAQGIYHLQFNWGSAHPSGPLPEVIDEIASYAGVEFKKRNMVVAAVAGNANMVDVEPEKRQKAIDKLLMIIPVCGKIGTVENFIRLNNEKTQLTDHSIFIGFAPKEDPKIAIAVFIENGYWGARWAAPIGSLMIEKYLKGKVIRQWLETNMINGSLIAEYQKPFLGKPFVINE